MGTPLSTQHPAVVLRSHYRHLRSLLAIAMVAIVALSVTVVLLAGDDDDPVGSTAASQVSAPGPSGTVRFDGGPEEGTRGIIAVQVPNQRFDGGPEEGTRGPLSSPVATSESRFDGGPEEGTRGPGR